MAEFKNFDSSVLEGHIKFREKKTWKRRWCVVRRLSPVANSLIMQFYKKSLSKGKGSQSKSSLNLEHLLGFESCFLLQKESQTLAIVCRNFVSVFAFESREMLLEWQAQIAEILGHSERFEVQLLSVPGKLEITSSSAVLHIRDWQFALTQGIPPRLIGYWNMADLRRFGAVDDRRFCFEGGSRCSSRGFEGIFVLGSNQSHEIANKFEFSVRGRLSESQRTRIHPSSTLNGLLTPMMRHRLSVNSRCPSQTMSKPNTPILGSQRRAQEFCLSPPCARHTRSYSQQHSRTSSISSGTRLSSALQRSDPELLYDKPRSLNATMSQAVYEVCGGGNSESRPSSTLPTSHYDTPRRILQNLGQPPLDATTQLISQPNGNTLEVPGGISSLYATVTKSKKAKKPVDPSVSDGEVMKASVPVEVQGYLVMQRGQNQWNQQEEYVQMQSLPCSPATLLQRQRCLAPAGQCSGPCCKSNSRDKELWSNQVYQNSLWLQLQAEGAAINYQNPITFRCLYTRPCYPHCTLPLLHSRSTTHANNEAVPLRLRRSASMPAAACRQGNRDSSDSTDSGVSVTADSLTHQASMAGCVRHHHHLLMSRHWSLPRPHVTAQQTLNAQLWADSTSRNPAAVTTLSAALATTTPTPNGILADGSNCQSNSSSLSNILDRLDTLSVASIGYETCV